MEKNRSGVSLRVFAVLFGDFLADTVSNNLMCMIVRIESVIFIENLFRKILSKTSHTMKKQQLKEPTRHTTLEVLFHCSVPSHICLQFS